MESKLAGPRKTTFKIANWLDDEADAIRKRSKQAYAAGRMGLEE